MPQTPRRENQRKHRTHKPMGGTHIKHASIEVDPATGLVKRIVRDQPAAERPYVRTWFKVKTGFTR